jgi:hypothetical protein
VFLEQPLQAIVVMNERRHQEKDRVFLFKVTGNDPGQLSQTVLDDLAAFYLNDS